jgi:hypothetical protein
LDLLFADTLDLVSRDVLGPELAPPGHKGLKIFVITGDMKAIVAGVVGQTDKIAASLAKRLNTPVGRVAKNGGRVPGLGWGRAQRRRDLLFG